MKLREEIIQKYMHYQQNGLRLFTVTLSTYVKSSWFVKQSDMRSMWEEHFIYRVKKRLTYKLRNKVDYDFVIESPSSKSGYHFHGIVALTPDGAERIWCDGGLHPQLVRDLNSLQEVGLRRPCKINKFLVELVDIEKLNNWNQYITKEYDLIASSVHFPQ